jgi:hypothetical protein
LEDLINPVLSYQLRDCGEGFGLLFVGGSWGDVQAATAFLANCFSNAAITSAGLKSTLFPIFKYGMRRVA